MFIEGAAALIASLRVPLISYIVAVALVFALLIANGILILCGKN